MLLHKTSLLKKIALGFLILIAVYLLLLAAVSIYIAVNKEKIISSVEKAIRENVRGNATIKNFDVAVWSSFPKIEIELNDVVITDSVYHKPFLQLHQIAAGIGLFDLLGKEKNISSVKLSDGFIHVFTDTSGYTNAYLASGKKKTENTKGEKIFIENITLKNVTLISENNKSDKKFELQFEKMDADINKQNDSLWEIKMDEKCLVKGLGFNLEKGSYVNDQTIEAVWKIHLNTKNISFSFDKTTASFNDHPFILDGAFFLKDSSHFFLNVTTDQLPYQQAVQLVPQNIQRTLNLFKLSQPLDVSGSIKGPMAAGTTPLVNVDWSVKESDIVTNVASLKNCAFTGIFTNQVQKNLPLSDENSEVLLRNFSGYWGEINLTGKNILVSNLNNSVLQFDLSSDCNFAQLDSTLALNSVRFVDGKVHLELLYNGPLVDDMTLLNKLNLKLTLRDGVVQYVPRDLTFNNCNGNIQFANNTLQGGNIQCDLKQNHFQVNIAGNGLSKLSDSIAGKADIFCSVSTPSLNLSDFKNIFSSTTKTKTAKTQNAVGLAGTASQIDNLLENGNLLLTINADKIFLDKFEATGAKAKLIFRQNDWEIANASLVQSGGTLNISAKISNTNNHQHQAQANLNIQNADVKKVFYAFDNFGQQGITDQNLRGILNTNATVSCNINNKGDLLKNSITGSLFFSLKKGALLNYKPLEQIKVSFLKNRNLNDIEFAELKDSIDIRKEDIYLHRMEIASSALTCFVEGIFSFGNNTDISIQVPFSNLKKQPENYKPKNNGPDAKAGPSLYFRARPDKSGQIKIGLDLFKKFRGDDFSKMKNDSL
jgi:hypothetical protein